MDIRVLNYFLMVAREENITRSAQLLHITQPTLSRQLMQLEEELGVKLFQRSNHSIYLTSEGLLFRRRAQELVNLAEKAKSELSQTETILTGEITIGCGESQGMNELSEIITDFLEKHPFVKFELHSGNNNDIKEWLEQGTLDMGLLLEPVEIGKYNFVRMNQKDEWGVLVHKDSKFAMRDAIHPGDLVGIGLITVMDDPIHNELTSWSGDYAKQMEPIVHYNLLSNAATMVRRNAGVAVCSKPNCHYDDLSFVPFSPKLLLGSVLAWKEHQTVSKANNAFINFIKKYKK
ncbi:LysR family transcriptional regulator [Priestia aryabhattai]|uniref:LysR family transcriptional regulator n=1 Tax=Priestia megaterium TaxID=1404 RepID=UPI003F9997CB